MGTNWERMGLHFIRGAAAFAHGTLKASDWHAESGLGPEIGGQLIVSAEKG